MITSTKPLALLLLALLTAMLFVLVRQEGGFSAVWNEWREYTPID